jgi:hypothetical protein
MRSNDRVQADSTILSAAARGMKPKAHRRGLLAADPDRLLAHQSGAEAVRIEAPEPAGNEEIALSQEREGAVETEHEPAQPESTARAAAPDDGKAGSGCCPRRLC